MPDDCIIAFGHKGDLYDTSRTEIYDLYSQTDYIGNLGKNENVERVKQSMQYQEVSEDLGMSNDIIDVGGTAFDLFS